MSRCSYKTDGTYLCDMVETFVSSGPCTGIKTNCNKGQYVDTANFCLCTDSSKPNFYNKSNIGSKNLTLNNEELRTKLSSLVPYDNSITSNNMNPRLPMNMEAL